MAHSDDSSANVPVKYAAYFSCYGEGFEEQDSIEEQEQLVRGWCALFLTEEEQEGLKVYHEHPAWLSDRGLDLPARDELYEDLREGEVDVLILTDLSRLGLSMCSLGEFYAAMLRPHGAALVSIWDAIDTRRPIAEFAMSVLNACERLDMDVLGRCHEDLCCW